VAELPITFPSGEMFNLTFYVTLLDSSCSMVLGHNWLKQHNPLIDWSSSQISFCSDNHRGLALLTSFDATGLMLHNPPPSNTPMDSVKSMAFGSTPTPDPIPDPIPGLIPRLTPPPISLINAAAYLLASKLPGSIAFQLQLAPDGTFGRTAAVSEPDLSSVPEDHHKFADVFNKGKADKLPPHHSYNLKIEIEDGTPPPSRMYSLSQSELETL
jgi:hypothetical protein